MPPLGGEGEALSPRMDCATLGQGQIFGFGTGLPQITNLTQPGGGQETNQRLPGSELNLAEIIQ